jgi:hypothetical protein
LAAHDRAGSNSKTLARELKLPLRTVQYHLRQLVRDEIVQEPYRGHFVWTPGVPDILADPEGEEGIHGLVLASLSLRDAPLRTSLCARFPGLLEHERGIRYGEHLTSWKDHVVRLRLYGTTGRLLVYVPSSRLPIRFGAFGEFVGWLSGILHPLRPEDLRVVQVGIHTDYGGWTLKGIQAVELRRFLNASEQLYQKVGTLRHEVHLVPRDLTLDQAVRIIREGSPTAQLERLLRLEVEIERRREPGPAATPRDPRDLLPSRAHEGGYG